MINNIKTHFFVIIFLLLANNLSAQTINYTYDNLGRLTQAVYPDNSTISYTYDANGNRLSVKTKNPNYLKPQTIVFKNLGLTYGAADTIPGAKSSSGLDVSYASSNGSVATIVNGKLHIIGVGTSYITATQGGNTSYLAVAPVQDTLIVKQAILTIKALDAIKSYGTANPTLKVLYTGFVNGDDSSKLITKPTLQTAATTSSVAGTYTITASGAESANYTFNYINGTLTILPATVPVLTFPAIATATYGSPDIISPATSTNKPGPISYSSSNTAVATITSDGSIHIVGAGNTIITASQAAYDTDAAAIPVEQTLKISPAPLLITADDKSKVYGEDNPPLTLSYAGFVNNENPAALLTQASASTIVTAATPPGTYTITAEGATSANYKITFATGTFTVNQIPAPTITAFTPNVGITGTTVIIIGTNFTNASVVTFGGVPAASFIINSPVSITAILGAGTSGDVTITTPGGTVSSHGFNYSFSLPSDNFKLTINSATCKGSNDGTVTIAALQQLSYTATITGNGLNNTYSFSNSTTINSLSAGTYNLCISVTGQPDYQQCYTIVITEPKDLSLYTMVNTNNNTVVISLDGGAQYHVQLNGTDYATTSNTLTLPLKYGDNELVVTTDALCQGTIRKVINSLGNITPYPDPFQDIINLNLGDNNIKAVSVVISSADDGKVVLTQQFSNQSGVIQLDVAKLNHGVYVLKLSMDQTIKIFKIIKK